MPMAASASATIAKPAEQPHRQPRNGGRLGRDVGPACTLVERRRRLDRAQRRAHRRHGGFGIAGRAQEQRDGRRRLLLEREVHVRARLVAERGTADVADDADDLGAVLSPSSTRWPTGLSPGKNRCAMRLADDHDRRRLCRVARVEQAPGAQRNAQAPEIAARRRLPADVRRPLARRHRLFGPLERHRPVVAGERRDDRRRRSSRPRAALRSRRTRDRKRTPRVDLRIASRRQPQLHRQHTVARGSRDRPRSDSRSCAASARPRSAARRRARFRRRPEPMPRARAAGSSSSRRSAAQRVARGVPLMPMQATSAEEQRRTAPTRRARTPAPQPLMPTSSRPGSGVARGTSAASAGDGPPRDEHAGDAAGKREHEALGQDLRDQPSASGAERQAHRHFLLARERSREQQVADVGARDEQHEADRREQDDQRPLGVADQRVAQRHRVVARALILLRKLALELLRQRVELRRARRRP